jgi:hypothetical protein
LQLTANQSVLFSTVHALAVLQIDTKVMMVDMFVEKKHISGRAAAGR